MEWIQQLWSQLSPPKVLCAEEPFDELQLEHSPDEEFEPLKNIRTQKVPGFDHIFNSVLAITAGLDLIRGFKFDLGVPLSPAFNMLMSWTIPNEASEEKPAFQHPMMQPVQTRPLFTLTTQLAKDLVGREPHTVLVAKRDSEGKMDAFFLRKLSKEVSLRLTGNFPNSNMEHSVISADLEYEDQDFSGVLRVGPGMWAVNAMQRVHEKLMLGFDYTNMYSQRMSFFGYALKAFVYNHRLFSLYLPMQQQINLAYMIPICKGTTFVSHYRYEPRETKSTAILGVRQVCESTEVIATVNSRGKITSSMLLKGVAYSLRISAIVDYFKNKYIFGYGITIGAQQ